MSVAATVNLTSLLTSLGFDQGTSGAASGADEMTVETFDSWHNARVSMVALTGVCGTCAHDCVPDMIPA
jgi:hypothetical protein